MKLSPYIESIFKYKNVSEENSANSIALISVCIFVGIFFFFLFFQTKMRDHREGMVMLPFSFGCGSDSSVAVGKNINQTKKHTVSDQQNLHRTSTLLHTFPPPLFFLFLFFFFFF